MMTLSFLLTASEGGEYKPPRMFWFSLRDRICVGRFFADATVWFTLVSLLAVFDILPAKDENGEDIDITDYEYTDGAIM